MKILLVKDKCDFIGLRVFAELTGKVKNSKIINFIEPNQKQIVISLNKTDGENGEEESLRRACREVYDFALKNGCKNIAFDVKSFVENSEDVPYVTNILIEELSSIAEKEKSDDLTFNILFAANGNYEDLLNELDEELSKPVLETVKHAYGAYGDTLKDEFEKFQKSLENEKTFREYLVDLMEQKGVRKSSELYKAAGVSKYTFSKITNFSLNPPHKPSKETVAALAIGLKLNLQEAEEFYNYAGFHLGLTEFVDKVIRFFIKKGIYKIYDVNYCLVEYGYLPLGEKPRREKVEIKIK